MTKDHPRATKWLIVALRCIAALGVIAIALSSKAYMTAFHMKNFELAQGRRLFLYLSTAVFIVSLIFLYTLARQRATESKNVQ